MQRREFLSRFAVAGTTATGIAVAASARTQDAIGEGAARVREELKAMNDRLERMDKNQRRMLKLLIIVASYSTGMDALRLLNGDLLS